MHYSDNNSHDIIMQPIKPLTPATTLRSSLRVACSTHY